MRLPLVALLIAAALPAAPADAALVDFTFFADAIHGSTYVRSDGTVVDLAGQEIAVRVRYDSATAADYVDPASGVAVYGLGGSIGSFTGTIAGLSVAGGLVVQILPDRGLATGELNFADRDQLLAGGRTSNFGFRLPGGVVTSAALPDAATLARYVAASVGGGGGLGDPAQRLVSGYLTDDPIRGRPTSAPAVPEPAQWLTLVVGFGLLGAALRRRPRVRIAFARQ